jgi:hypothetical protein
MVRSFAPDQLPMEGKGILIAGYDPQCIRDHFVTELSNRTGSSHNTYTSHSTQLYIIVAWNMYIQCIHLMSVQYVLIYKQCIHLMWTQYVFIYKQCIHLTWVQYMLIHKQWVHYVHTIVTMGTIGTTGTTGTMRSPNAGAVYTYAHSMGAMHTLYVGATYE